MPKNIKSETVKPEVILSEAPDLRRQRYARSSLSSAFVSLTPVRVEMLQHLAELRFLSLPQIAKLCCPSERHDLSEKNARRHMRELFDAGLVDVLPVSRAALAPPGAPNDASLLYGSAPNVYAPTLSGLETLHHAGLIDQPLLKKKGPTYGPKNSLFLAHELAVRDVYVWLKTVACSGGHVLEAWHDGEAAAIPLRRTQAPFSVRPDAWFVLRLQEAVLVGLVEVDRGTERGDFRWSEKLNVYETLFSGGSLQATTGYTNARVLVFTPDERRRIGLASYLWRRALQSLAPRFWLTEIETLNKPYLSLPVWHRPGTTGCQALVPRL